MRFQVTTSLLSLLPTLLLAQDISLRQVKHSFTEAKIPEDLFLVFEPSVLLEVAFPQADGSKLFIHAGENVPRNLTAIPPTFSIIGESAGKGPFILAMVDPDMPTPQDPSMAQVRHGLAPNLTVQKSRGFQLIQPLTNSTPALTLFRQPTPPAGSDPHRYIFLLYKQPRSFAHQTVINSTSNIFNFNVTKFAEETNLGRPIAGSFIYVAPPS